MQGVFHGGFLCVWAAVSSSQGNVLASWLALCFGETSQAPLLGVSRGSDGIPFCYQFP